MEKIIWCMGFYFWVDLLVDVIYILYFRIDNVNWFCFCLDCNRVLIYYIDVFFIFKLLVMYVLKDFFLEIEVELNWEFGRIVGYLGKFFRLNIWFNKVFRVGLFGWYFEFYLDFSCN